MAGRLHSITCVIPTFNRWSLLAERLAELEEASVELAHLGILEIVVVDDHSDSPCPPQLIRQIFRMSGKYIRLHKNSGTVSIPRNVGIANTSSEFIAHIDDDVRILPGKFHALLSLFSNDIDLAYAGVVIEDRDGNTGYSYRKNWNPLLSNGYGVDGSQFIYRRRVYGEVPLHFAMRGCDWELAKRIFKVTNFASIDTPVALYKWHGKNRSLDPETKVRPIFPAHFKAYFEPWIGSIDYTPIPAT